MIRASSRVPADDPIAMFSTLFERAARDVPEPDAMVLSTVDPDGRPSARYVLLKGVDERGFVFYTNLESRKARALAAHPHAALTFYWPPATQVRIEGGVERVSDAEADAYFATRPRGSQIGAWASPQSAALASRAALDAARSARSRRASRARRSRGRRSGAATASSRGRSSSGPAIRAAARTRAFRRDRAWTRSLRFLAPSPAGATPEHAVACCSA